MTRESAEDFAGRACNPGIAGLVRDRDAQHEARLAEVAAERDALRAALADAAAWANEQEHPRALPWFAPTLALLATGKPAVTLGDALDALIGVRNEVDAFPEMMHGGDCPGRHRSSRPQDAGECDCCVATVRATLARAGR